MADSIHAPFCADHAVQITSPVLRCERVAKDTYRVRVEADAIAKRVVPGQFVMMRIAGTSDPLIGRALAVYDVIPMPDGAPWQIDVIFVAKGKFTTALALLGDGASVTLWGPLGNGFSPTPTETLLIAVGGVGQTPMLALAQEALGQKSFDQNGRIHGYARRVIMVYGARTGDYLATIDAFQATGMELILCTDDGSVGHHGRVPEILSDVLQRSDLGQIRMVTCGPEPMMERVAEIAEENAIECEVSLETPMACGIGICFTCVAKIRQEEGGWDYKRTCVEGPIFDASQIVWD